MGKTSTDERRFLSLLARGGVEADEGRLGGHHPPKYNGLVDPAGAEELATALASRVKGDPSVVVIWEDPEDVVLGHVVARTLGLPVVRAYNADGLVGHGAGLEAGAAVLFVADAVRDPVVVRAVRALAQRDGGSLASTAVLIETSALREAADESGHVIALLRAPDDRGESSGED
jgi:adenine/guanine phosphoribosyltransferase-like PRPP-binding protein